MKKLVSVLIIILMVVFCLISTKLQISIETEYHPIKKIIHYEPINEIEIKTLIGN